MKSIDLNAGAVAPVAREIDLVTLRVTGKVPDDLDGVLVAKWPEPSVRTFRR